METYVNKNLRSDEYLSSLICFESQALADRIALPCTLTRGEYNRAWNEVMLPETPEQVMINLANFVFSEIISVK